MKSTRFARPLLSLIALGAMSVSLAGCGSKVNMDNYNKINTGMSQADVEAILGSGTESNSGGVAGVMEGKTVVYKNGDSKTITVAYLNGKVATKAEQGL